MIDYTAILEKMHDETKLRRWVNTILPALKGILSQKQSKNYCQWISTLQSLPQVFPEYPCTYDGCITFGTPKMNTHECNTSNELNSVQQKIKNIVMQLNPWRIGPYSLQGVLLDSEWRSDIKWNRLLNFIQPLTGKKVLDVGCNNGYFCWRMIISAASLVIGIDPYLLNTIQFHCINHFSKPLAITVFPFSLQSIPHHLEAFDTIFSMGVLYHQRAPLDHIIHLRECLVGGGELVLETLIIDGGMTDVLVPEGRYAKMRNVWFIPSLLALESWLKRCRMKDICIIDSSYTTSLEQRKSECMNYESLQHFLDPINPLKTIEGYPAPQRVILTAKKQ